ncbi:hypothetical protein DCO48_15490 [Pseudomonas sp. SDI]|uniref:hypothetical protein n=1 Tax=Pseudomonas sp. SDI TaxID=2170734 RepID=UPI000DE5F441|nr:hypothetical protein [Pseudomonas sp. SDI]PWB31850.1 hypothetical protein DCO48_15490 [Pseudomonas sp. SDI]
MKHALPGCLVLLISLDSHALSTAQLPPETLHSLGQTLAQTAGSSQWQQLWQRSRAAGYLDPRSELHFTLAQAQLPALAKATLASAQQVSAEGVSLARYRRDFHPTEIGLHGQTRLSALCLWVDWRTVPTPLPIDTRPHLRQVSLLRAQPC